MSNPSRAGRTVGEMMDYFKKEHDRSIERRVVNRILSAFKTTRYAANIIANPVPTSMDELNAIGLPLCFKLAPMHVPESSFLIGEVPDSLITLFDEYKGELENFVMIFRGSIPGKLYVLHSMSYLMRPDSWTVVTEELGYRVYACEFDAFFNRLNYIGEDK